MSAPELPKSRASFDTIPQTVEPSAGVFISNQALWLLGELASELSPALDLKTLQYILSHKLRWIFNFDHCTLAVWPELTDSEYLLFEIKSSSSKACTPPQRIPLSEGWPGRVLTESKPYFLADLTQLPPLVAVPMNAQLGIAPKACSLMLLPLRTRERSIGSLNFSSNTLGTYSLASWHLANLLAAQIGAKLVSILAHQQTCIAIKALEQSQARLKRDMELRERRIAQLEEQVREFQKLNQLTDKFLSPVFYKPDQSWKCVHTLTRHSRWIESVTISANGQILASGNGDSTIDLWHLATGTLLRTLRSSNGVSTIALSPDGQTLVSGSHDNTIHLWHLGTGQLLDTLTGYLGRISCVAISPDGQTLASSSGYSRIELWHLSTGERLGTLRHNWWHSRSIESVAISANGQILASGNGDSTIDLWHLATGTLLRTLRSSNGVSTVALSPDGQTLVSGSHDNTIELWHLGTGELLHTLIGHSGAVYSVAISPDGQNLVSGSHDHKIKIWHLGTGELLHTLIGHLGAVYSVAISPDGQNLASGSHDQTIKIWRRC
jgi:WD40 repeat protein